MSKFGIIGEGYTDQVTIQNILCGFFNDKNLDEDIAFLPHDEKGGWEVIFNYLTTENFRNDTLSNQFIIFQIDTDITKKEEDSIKFGVSYKDDHGNELATETLINKVIIRLVSKINEGKLGFYQKNINKIIFAISVHEMECWLVSYHAKDEHRNEKDDCCNVLKKTELPQNIQFSKKRKSRCHEKLSYLAFSKREDIDAITERNISFKHFIQALEKIPLPEVI